MVRSVVSGLSGMRTCRKSDKLRIRPFTVYSLKCRIDITYYRRNTEGRRSYLRVGASNKSALNLQNFSAGNEAYLVPRLTFSIYRPQSALQDINCSLVVHVVQYYRWQRLVSRSQTLTHASVVR